MQIHCLHGKLYKLLKQVAPEEKRSELEKIYQNQVDTWGMLHKHKVSDEIKQKMVKISRATYYRRKKFLRCPILNPKDRRTSEKVDLDLKHQHL